MSLKSFEVEGSESNKGERDESEGAAEESFADLEEASHVADYNSKAGNTGTQEDEVGKEFDDNVLKEGHSVDELVEVIFKEESSDTDEINDRESEDSDWDGRALDLSQRRSKAGRSRLQADDAEGCQQYSSAGTAPDGTALQTRTRRSLRRTRATDRDSELNLVQRSGEQTDKSTLYFLHISASYTRKSKPYTCQHCDFKCNRKNTLNEHLASKHDVKPFNCPLCVYRCSMNAHLQRHINNVHNKVKPYGCQHCDSKFSQKTVLTRHILAVHDKHKPHSCKHCGYKFSQKAHLINHVTAVHDKVKPYGCLHCDYKCSVREHLKRHISAVHDQVKPYSCHHCGYRFSRNGHLLRHISVAHSQMRM